MTHRGRLLEIVALAAWAAAPASGQTVAVRVLHGESAQPIAGAIVYLENADGATVARSLTDETGRALFYNVGPGLHRVRAEMIGMASDRGQPFEARLGPTIEQRIVLLPAPIALEGLAVEAAQRCRTGAGEGLVTARVWDETRKALIATELTEERRLYRYQTMLYEQDLDRDTRLVRRSRQSRREAAMESPFQSRPVDELIERGFVEQSGAVDLYFAPDASVLLSDLFLETHCFRVREGGQREETAGLVGLAFEPTADRRDVVEIAGTLWLDPSTSELRWLEYRYVDSDPELQLDDIGGRVEFRRMPEGGWIVPRWWIRMPRLALQRTLDGESLRTYVAGFREAGGVVLDVQGAGRALGHSLTGALEGLIEDSLGAAMPGVRVELVGTELARVTDSTGIFRFDGLVEGVYEVRVVDPALDRLGFPPVTFTRAVVNGEATVVDVGMASVRALLTASCADVPPEPVWQEQARELPSRGIAYGWVLDAETQEPLAGAQVRVLTPTIEFRPLGRRTTPGPAIDLGGVPLNDTNPLVVQGTFGLATTTNERGFYRVCNVPESQRIDVSAIVDGVETEPREIRIAEPGGIIEQSFRVARAP